MVDAPCWGACLVALALWGSSPISQSSPYLCACVCLGLNCAACSTPLSCWQFHLSVSILWNTLGLDSANYRVILTGHMSFSADHSQACNCDCFRLNRWTWVIECRDVDSCSVLQICVRTNTCNGDSFLDQRPCYSLVLSQLNYNKLSSLLAYIHLCVPWRIWN